MGLHIELLPFVRQRRKATSACKKCLNRKAIYLHNAHKLALSFFLLVISNRYLFWTVLGKKPKIERARLDGTERTSIVTTGLYLPNDLQIDYSARRILWIDAIKDKVESSDFEGKNRVVLTDVSYYGAVLMHPYSMAFFPQHSLVYFTDWYRSWVIYKKTSAILMTALYQSFPRILEIGQIRILHHSIQPPGSYIHFNVHFQEFTVPWHWILNN